MTTIEYRLYPRPTKRYTASATTAPQPYPRHSSRPAHSSRPGARSGHSASSGHGSLLHPEGELAERTRQYQLRREAAEAIPRTHLPVWRLRLAIARGFLPLVWMFPRCQVDGCRHWPCGPLLNHLHAIHGWGTAIDEQIKALSIKRRRAKASRRNPTAVSHRAIKARRRIKGRLEDHERSTAKATT